MKSHVLTDTLIIAHTYQFVKHLFWSRVPFFRPVARGVALLLWCPPSRRAPCWPRRRSRRWRPPARRCLRLRRCPVCAGASARPCGGGPGLGYRAARLPASPVSRPGGPLDLSWCVRPRPFEGGAVTMRLSARLAAPVGRGAQQASPNPPASYEALYGPYKGRGRVRGWYGPMGSRQRAAGIPGPLMRPGPTGASRISSPSARPFDNLVFVK